MFFVLFIKLNVTGKLKHFPLTKCNTYNKHLKCFSFHEDCLNVDYRFWSIAKDKQTIIYTFFSNKSICVKAIF